jgi:hypothetical protein
MYSLKRLAGLPPRERLVLARALLLLPLAAAGVRTLGLKRTQAWLVPRLQSRSSRHGVDPARIARMVQIAARRGPVRAKCLPASLALQALLARAGVASELRVGVRKRGARLEAHAWVEHEGVALMEPEGVHARFSAFARPIAPERDVP